MSKENVWLQISFYYALFTSTRLIRPIHPIHMEHHSATSILEGILIAYWAFRGIWAPTFSWLWTFLLPAEDTKLEVKEKLGLHNLLVI